MKRQKLVYFEVGKNLFLSVFEKIDLKRKVKRNLLKIFHVGSTILRKTQMLCKIL